jgi:hypothetical protein
MKKSIINLSILCFLLSFFACQKTDLVPDFKHHTPVNENEALSHTKKYPAKVATDWINLQQSLSKTTPGFGPGTTGRAFSYSGLALYESVLPGMPSYQSDRSKVT